VEPTLGVSHIFHQTDAFICCVLTALLTMSIACSDLMIAWAPANRLVRSRAERLLTRFWNAASPTELRAKLASEAERHPFASLTRLALQAHEDRESDSMRKRAAAGGMGDYVTPALRNGIDREATRLENGLALLASTGSVAPCTGLAGTVWGIYRAFLQIGLSGQETLDKVAGPAGEALIMTGPGLAVGDAGRARLQRLRPQEPRVARTARCLRPRTVCVRDRGREAQYMRRGCPDAAPRIGSLTR
jgi:biopolymer transport protein ExbB